MMQLGRNFAAWAYLSQVRRKRAVDLVVFLTGTDFFTIRRVRGYRFSRNLFLVSLTHLCWIFGAIYLAQLPQQLATEQ